MSKENEKVAYKLIAVGDSNVGKTSILNRFVNDKYDETSQPTLGAAFMTKKFTLSNKQTVQLHIWDTAGQQKYRAIAPIYYRQAKIALCVYDITSKKSFDVMKNWVAQLEQKGQKDIAVVGNKIDRMDDEQVDYAEVKKYATQKNALLKLVSAKESKNIKDLFDAVSLQVWKKQSKLGSKGNKGQKNKELGKDGNKPGKSGCC